MHGHVQKYDETTGRPVSRRHRAPTLLPAPLALGLTVAVLLTAFGLGAALMPDNVTGRGVAAEPAPRADLLADRPPGLAGTAGGDQLPDASADSSAGPSGDAAAPAAAPPPAAPAPSRTSAKPKPTPKQPARRKPPAKPKPKPVGSGQVSQENEVIRLANVERRRAGCGSLTMSTKLRRAMRLHVQELGRRGDLYISHVSDDGRSFADRARAQGYDSPGGENVARGQRDAADVMDGWMNSAGHRANILNCSFKAIGVGVIRGVDGTLVWGQVFGRS